VPRLGNRAPSESSRYRAVPLTLVVKQKHTRRERDASHQLEAVFFRSSREQRQTSDQYDGMDGDFPSVEGGKGRAVEGCSAVSAYARPVAHRQGTPPTSAPAAPRRRARRSCPRHRRYDGRSASRKTRRRTPRCRLSSAPAPSTPPCRESRQCRSSEPGS
jgi:hypothetical protein